jgi:hypothetical protein
MGSCPGRGDLDCVVQIRTQTQEALQSHDCMNAANTRIAAASRAQNSFQAHMLQDMNQA